MPRTQCGLPFPTSQRDPDKRNRRLSALACERAPPPKNIRTIMFNYEFPRDQRQCQFGIGLDVPVADMSRNFFVPGKAQLGFPRVAVSAFCQGITLPARFTVGDIVPL